MQTAVPASVMGFPGIGQLMQKRWLAGSVFALVFAVALTLFLIEVGGILKAFYAFAFDFQNAQAPNARLPRLFITFAAAMAVYVANVVDVIAAQTRMSRHRSHPGAPPAVP